MVVVVVVVVSKAAWHFWSPVFVVKVLDRLNLILVILQVDAISFFLSWIDRLSFFLLLSFSFFFLDKDAKNFFQFRMKIFDKKL